MVLQNVNINTATLCYVTTQKISTWLSERVFALTYRPLKYVPYRDLALDMS